MANWTTSVGRSAVDPDKGSVVIIRHDDPQIYMEVDFPGFGGEAGRALERLARNSLKSAVTAMQQALESHDLPGHIEQFARRT